MLLDEAVDYVVLATTILDLEPDRLPRLSLLDRLPVDLYRLDDLLKVGGVAFDVDRVSDFQRCGKFYLRH